MEYRFLPATRPGKRKPSSLFFWRDRYRGMRVEDTMFLSPVRMPSARYPPPSKWPASTILTAHDDKLQSRERNQWSFGDATQHPQSSHKASYRSQGPWLPSCITGPADLQQKKSLFSDSRPTAPLKMARVFSKRSLVRDATRVGKCTPGSPEKKKVPRCRRLVGSLGRPPRGSGRQVVQ